jgi:glycosyltransferase involved in cell wall biosynthesis
MPDTEIRVARVIARINVGGPAIHVCNLTARLPPPFVSRLYVGDVSPDEKEMTDVVQREGVTPIRVRGLGRAIRLADAWAYASLFRKLREFRPHIVHTHTSKAGTLGRLAARAVGAPIVIHTFHGHVFEGNFSPLAEKAAVTVERTLAHVTDAIVTLSPLQKMEIVEMYRVAPGSKVHIIPLGFDFKKFDHVAEKRGELHRELGLADDVPLVASVARLAAIKNHSLLLQAFTRVRKNAQLVIVGGGAEEPRLRALAAELGIQARVHFLGFRSDLDRILADAKVVALSSLNEGTPVAFIEGLAAGCIPVGTAVGGVEDVLEGGRWGKVVYSLSAEDFGAALEAALDEVRSLSDSEVSARKAYARSRYGVFRLVADHSALYRSLLAKKGLS